MLVLCCESNTYVSAGDGAGTLQRRFSEIVFVYPPPCRSRKHLTAPDVHILGDSRGVSPGVERDLALLAACNHTIFDYGTYGFFAAFLAGNQKRLFYFKLRFFFRRG